VDGFPIVGPDDVGLDVEGVLVGLADVGMRDVGRDVGLRAQLGLVAVDAQGMDAHLVVSRIFA
jgi:hypothetical protein